ncbi:MAG: class I SAM-dependent methyltransferase [Saprospiraceae bacterium]
MKQQTAFDAYAEQYDASFTHTSIGRLQRAQVWQALNPLLQGTKAILEVNCGTGEDALQMAQLGHRVEATDISENMIKVCQAKAAKLKGVRELHFQTASFLQLAEKFAPQSFDLLFSNFGGLNCIGPEDTQTFSQIGHRLLKPGGKLFLVYISKACVWERLYFSYQKEVEKAQRRSAEGPIISRLEGHAVPIWYYSYKELVALFREDFRVIQRFPIGLCVPPSYLEPLFKNREYFLKGLGWLDQGLRWPSLANYGDHIGVVLERKD